MTEYPEASQINEILNNSKRILIIQADNPDGDSLGSALALEQIFEDMGKDTYLYCGVTIPTYLRYLEGWDRVFNELPHDFDVSFIVDTTADLLLGSIKKSPNEPILKSKPCIALDHHDIEPDLPYSNIICSHEAVATGELIYNLAKQLNWTLNQSAKEHLMVAILADSLGLTSQGTTAKSIYIVAELVESGVQIAELENRRRQLMRKSPEVLAYKGELLQRIEYFDNNRIATVTIPWEEIQIYSHQYNPSVLVIDDMRLVEGVDVAIAFKVYNDGKVTAKIHCNYGKNIAGKLAMHFGGGGHPYASGFKVNNRSIQEVKQECIEEASKLLDKLKE